MILPRWDRRLAGPLSCRHDSRLMMVVSIRLKLSSGRL